MADRKPFTKMDAANHFMWTLVAGFAIMIGVLVLSYQNQAQDPANIRQVCAASWDCEHNRPRQTLDLFAADAPAGNEVAK